VCYLCHVCLLPSRRYCFVPHRYLPSFPTRRSSDLVGVGALDITVGALPDGLGDGRLAERGGEPQGVLPHLRELLGARLRELLRGLSGGLVGGLLLRGPTLLLRRLPCGFGALGLLLGLTLPTGQGAVPLPDLAVLVEVVHAGAGDRRERGSDCGGGVEGVQSVPQVDAGRDEGEAPGDDPVVPVRPMIGGCSLGALKDDPGS